MSDPVIKTAVASFIVISMVMLSVFAYYYIHYERIIDRRMRGQLFNNTSKIFARPRLVQVGDPLSIEQIAAELRRAGYTDSGSTDSPVGSYRLMKGGIEIRPGAESFHSTDGAIIRVADGKIERVVGIGSNEGQNLAGYELEPQLVTALFEGEQRSKRQVVKFDEIPKVMVDAVLAIEDRRFFQHSGVNYFRFVQAALIDLREGRHAQGGSTITMQVSRAFFLTPEKTVKRKLVEMLIAIELEQKLTKPQIFELYANQIPMGQRGSFAVSGFAEAARSYFNKDIRSLTLPEAAMLAGIIQRPSYLSPYKHPERVLDRRNLVLESMVETGAITREECDRAKATPLKLAPPNVEASDAPYFVDLVKDTLQSRYSDSDLNEQGFRIYTTIDSDLQRAAAEAVEVGIKVVDEQVRKLRTRRVKTGKGKNAKTEETVVNGPIPQVALIALDPHTGEVLALVGGRNYGFSQLNHVVAKRPTGSIFKPFVFAAAMNTAINSDLPENVITASSLIDDAPTTFAHGDQIYEPRNYKNEYHGQVTARYALAMSLNNATVKLAETVGYDNVVALARASGITSVRATPSMALGAYDASPLEMAGAYTIFANGGVKVDPLMLKSVRRGNGDVVEDFHNDQKPVLDPRIAYIMTDMMEAVVNSGTAAGVRSRGFYAPAAGKTGTSHDAWFAGYTSNLLCIVWVGYDDYSDLRLSGGVTAAPIWAEFMKRAVGMPQYKGATEFQQPSGVVDVQLDKLTNRLATASCPETYTAAFIAGTEPKETCEQGDSRNLFQRIFGGGQPQPLPPPTSNGPVHNVPANARAPLPGVPAQQANQQQPAPEKKKKGFFGRIFGAFKDDSEEERPAPAPPPGNGGNNPTPR
ncbi:MAG TPA: PBP1A family penicillin-binding protein [Clostridia bacterium]|nr:PBP1A family penicillin-binding protein [Clostridia bacterium]